MEQTGGGAGVATLLQDAVPTDLDRDDVTLAAQGDVRAFERLYRSHVARIHSLARRMLGDGLAGEAAQDVFVRAWQKLASFRGEAAFGTWLYRLAINVMLARRTSLAVERGRFRDEDGILESLPGRPGGSDARMDFEVALERLPSGARTVFVLYDVEGYRHDEIASMLGISTGTSKAQLHRARMILRRHLES
jgi:RNA polymerase sigma-70 factor, ECF subfamily